MAATRTGARATAKPTSLSGHRARSLKALQAMVRLYCQDHGHNHDDGHGACARLCPRCAALLRYSTRRLERCVFGDAKPNCADCRVHCYRADMREEIRRVMRYAGPRMLLRHPILTMAHMIAAYRPAPDPPGRKAARPEADARI